MGWFKKAVNKVIDPLVPESVKKTTDKLIPEAVKQNDAAKMLAMGINPAIGLVGAYTNASILTGYQNTGGDGGGAAKEDLGIGTLTDEEAQAAARKRLARASKYFTSALGDLSPIASAAQKVFS